MRRPSETLFRVFAADSGHPAACVWRGYIAHALLFYRQNDLKDFAQLLKIGREFSLGPGGAPPTSDRRPGRHVGLILSGLRKSERYWGSLRFSAAALKDFERAARLAPGCVWAHLFCGMAHEMHRRYTRAIGCFERAAALEPRWSWPLVLRGICRWYQADFSGSVEDFVKAARLDPGSELPLLFMARAKADLRDRSLVRDLDKALRLAPRSGFALSWRGRAMFVLKKTPQALKDLERSIPLLPEYDRGYSWLGVSYAELGRWREALPLLRRARRLNPYYPTTLYPLARASIELGRWREAAEALKAAAAIDRNGVWVEHRISMSHPNPACLRSLRDLDSYIARAPRASWALAWRGQTELLLQNYRNALRDLDGALRLSPNDAWALLWRGETHRRLGDHARALADFDRALKLSRHLSWAQAGRGFCLLALAKPRPALAALERSLKLQGHCAPALAWRGEALFSLGRVKAAAASFEAALELHPQDHWVSARLWKAKARLGDWGAVRDTLARWVRDGRSDSDEAWALLGWAEGRLGRAREEARCLSRALKLNSRNPVALLARRVGSRRIDAGAVETLAGLNDPAAHFSTDTMLGYCRRSLSRRCAAALERGELAAALALAESESKGGRDIQAFLFRGWLRLSTGDAQGAVEEASRALDETLDPGCRPALWLRARAAEGLHG